MKSYLTLFTASAMLACVVPVYAVETGSAAKRGFTAEKQDVLSSKMKKLKALRKKMPIPVPSGLGGVFVFPEKGQGVVGVNIQHHEFEGLIRGRESVSAETVVATTPNRFFGNPMQPATLRVVPERSKADVIFPFANFTVNDHFALVAVAPIIRKEAVLNVFNGPGTSSLGTSTAVSKGLGDIKFGALFKAYNNNEYKHNVVLNFVLSAPTGSITQEGYNLTPMNTVQLSRLGYGMQLGSGTWDANLGVSYWGKEHPWGWGAQYMATLPLESENSEGWRYGNKHQATAWLSYEWKPSLATSVRLHAETQDTIHGIDPRIYGPGLGADPDNYGGERASIGIGLNWMPAPANNLALELVLPFHQNRNGVQAEQELSVALSWRKGYF